MFDLPYSERSTYYPANVRLTLQRTFDQLYSDNMDIMISRNVFDWGNELLSHFPAVVIQGARQVGKSTFASMLTQDRPHMSFTLDDPNTLIAAQQDPTSFVTQAGTGILVIDEIQRDPGLLLAIKAQIDADRRPGRFLLTGSSDLLRLSQTPDSLAGRAVTVELGGFSQGELRGRREDFGALARHPDNLGLGGPSSWTRNDYIQTLAKGSYPEAQNLTSRLRKTWFDSYINRLLMRDVGDVSRGLSTDRLLSVVRLIAANQGGEVVQARLADSLAMPKSSVNSYLSALSTLYLTNDILPWRANLTKRQTGRHKISIADSGLALHLAKLTPDVLEPLTAAPTLGLQLEAFVASELTKQRGWSSEEYELFHFRDRNGLEVDLVIEFSDGHIFLIEVKATGTLRSEHSKQIKALGAKLGDRFIGGAVLTLVPNRISLGDNVWALPISALWES